MKSVGYKIGYVAYYQPTQTDFTANVLAMRNAGVNFVWLSDVDPNSMARILQAMYQQGYKPKVVMTAGTAYRRELLQTRSAGVGSRHVDGHAVSNVRGTGCKNRASRRHLPQVDEEGEPELPPGPLCRLCLGFSATLRPGSEECRSATNPDGSAYGTQVYP